MGFEYRAAVETQLKPAALNEIRELLKRSSLFEILDNGTRDQILFRRCSHPFDSNWPEEAMITLEDDYIYLLIHSATSSEKEALIEEISSNLGVEFREI